MRDNRREYVRKRLLREMDSACHRRIVYLVAPAGFGKTIALQQWLNSTKNHAYVCLDEWDNDIVSLCRRLAQALLRCQKQNTLLREAVDQPAFDSAPEEYLLRAVGTLKPGEPAYIAVDDLHYWDPQKADRVLRAFLNRLPASFHLLVASRLEPQGVFGEYLIRNELAMLDPSSIRFTAEEIRELLLLNDYDCTQEQADAILAQTDGWSIALNALLLTGSVFEEDNIFTERLADFVRTQMWSQWPEELRDFMRCTCVVEEMTPPLCDVLTTHGGAEQILRRLLGAGVFIRQSGARQYRYHHLFRDFLLDQLRESGLDAVSAQRRKAGHWYFAQGDIYHAMDQYLKCGYVDGIARCLAKLDHLRQTDINIDRMLSILKRVGRDVLESHPIVHANAAWAAMMEGRAKDMFYHMDQYYQNKDAIGQSRPDMAHGIFILHTIDPRFSIHEMARRADGTPLNSAGDFMVSKTKNMPLYHRATRDLSEFAGGDMIQKLDRVKAAIGSFYGEEMETIYHLTAGGVLYERRELPAAYRHAISALEGLGASAEPALKFCVMALLFSVQAALGDHGDANKTWAVIDAMIHRENALYLLHNSEALVLRNQLYHGESRAADSWRFESDGLSPGHLRFDSVYRLFTDARIHIHAGRYDEAILLLSRLRSWASVFSRPLDQIESAVLLSIAYWNKDKSRFHREALSFLEHAAKEAAAYGYLQVFAMEGSALTTMLHKLLSRARSRKDGDRRYAVFIKRLYHQSLESGLPVLARQQLPQSPRFTEKQLTVMNLLCAGYTYPQIGEEMGIKLTTVRSHINLIFMKLDVPNQTEAIAKIKQLDLQTLARPADPLDG